MTQTKKWLMDNSLHCKIYDLANIPSSEKANVSRIYDVWNQVYTPILKDSNEVLRSDYFFRTKFLVALFDESEKPLSFSLHNNYDLQLHGVATHSYFDVAPPAFMELISKEQHQVLTYEWVTVHPDERGRKTEAKSSHVLMGLASKAAQASPYTSPMGYSRVDFKADKNAELYGFKALMDTYRHNILCKVMFCRKHEFHPHPSGFVADVVDQVWEKRTNFSQHLGTEVAPRPLRKVA